MSKLLLKIFTQLLVLAVLASCGGGSEDEVPSLLTPPDETPPTISTITPAVDDTYLYNDNISFSITFSEVVTVSGVPSLTLSIDGSNFNLPFSSGSGTTTLVFDKNLDMEIYYNKRRHDFSSSLLRERVVKHEQFKVKLKVNNVSR